MKHLCWLYALAVFSIVITGFFLPQAIAQDDMESEVIEAEIDEEFKWLQEEADALMVTVATKTEMTVQEAPSIVSVITQDEIRNSGAKTLDEVLRQVAGFYPYQSSVYPNITLNIRGLSELTNPSVKIMINGHSLEEPVEQNSEWIISFPVDLIKKIEIIRGPGSALYGSAAMNGVINILTKDGKDPSKVSAAYGSFNTYRGTAQFSYSEDDVSLLFFADAFYSDGDPRFIEKDAASATFPPGYSYAPGYTNEEFECRTFFTKLSYKNFWLTGYYREDTREPPIGIGNALTDENYVPDKAVFAEAGYKGSLTDRTEISGKAYYEYRVSDTRYEMYSEDTAAYFGGFPQGEGIHMNSDADLYKAGTEFVTSINALDSLEIVAGALYEYMEEYYIKYTLNTNLIGRPMVLDGITYAPWQYIGGMKDVSGPYNYADEDKLKRTVYAGYVQGTWDIIRTFPRMKVIGKNLTLTAGLRYDKYDDVGSALTPRVGIVYAPNNRLFFKMLYGEAFRAPGFNEMYLKNNPAFVGNPDLEPETVKTAEILVGVNLTDRITATLDFFSVKKENTIRHYQTSFDNWGKIESRGVEGEIRFSYDKDKYGYFNVTFQDVTDVSHERMTDTGGTEYIQEDFNFGVYPELMANLGVNWDITRHVNANLSVNHIKSVERIGGKRFTADPNDPDGTLEKADKREPMKGYTLVTLSLILRNFDFAKNWELQLTGYNLLDSDHKAPQGDGSVENDLPRWGRHFMGKLTYRF